MPARQFDSPTLSIHRGDDPASREINSICVVGMGYIGLPTSAVLARAGYRVHGVDVRPHVVNTINSGGIHIHEPNLAELVESVVQQGALTCALTPTSADVFFLCVPTPITADNKPDVSYVQAAAQSIKPFVKAGDLIILESTSPPRTTQDVVIKHAIPDHLKVGEDVFVAYCPERVLPGRILIEVVQNDRIVGGVTPACTQRVVSFYQSFVEGQILPTTDITAETTKLVENSFRDVNIAFANELSILAEKLGIDVFEVIALANHHPRVKILTPGPGVGGHCISVDPWFLVDAAPELTPLIRTARQVNNSKPHHVVALVKAAAEQFKNPKIGCLGLAYKADVDDLRESPSLEITQEIMASGMGEVFVCEPYVTADTFGQFPLCSLDEVLLQADILVLLTDHQAFKQIPATILRTKTLIDTRGTWRSVLGTDNQRTSQSKAA